MQEQYSMSLKEKTETDDGQVHLQSTPENISAPHSNIKSISTFPQLEEFVSESIPSLLHKRPSHLDSARCSISSGDQNCLSESMEEYSNLEDHLADDDEILGSEQQMENNCCCFHFYLEEPLSYPLPQIQVGISEETLQEELEQLLVILNNQRSQDDDSKIIEEDLGYQTVFEMQHQLYSIKPVLLHLQELFLQEMKQEFEHYQVEASGGIRRQYGGYFEWGETSPGCRAWEKACRKRQRRYSTPVP